MKRRLTMGRRPTALGETKPIPQQDRQDGQDEEGYFRLPVWVGALLPLRRQFDRSAYEAAYLALAQATSQPLITGDERLFNAVHAQLDWVLWIEDYQAVEGG